MDVVNKKVEQLQKLYQGGPDKAQAIQILSLCSRAEVNAIIDALNVNNRNIAADIRDIVLFDDLVQLQGKEIETLTQHFTPELVGLALRLGSGPLREKFLSNVSPQEKQEIEAVLNGPPKKRLEVESAIIQIVTYARSLHEQGLFRFNITGQEVV